MKTIAIIDDSPEVRSALIELVESSQELCLGPVVGSAEELLEFLQTPEATFDVALVDLGLPGISGVELIARLRELRPDVECVAHTVYEDPTTVFSALRAGAAGYLLKGESGANLLRNLQALDHGGAPLTPKVARMLLGAFHREELCPLTDREREVLEQLSSGQTYKEVAKTLVVSSHTVHAHVKNIYEKLEVGGRREAVDKARRRGWLGK